MARMATWTVGKAGECGPRSFGSSWWRLTVVAAALALGTGLLLGAFGVHNVAEAQQRAPQVADDSPVAGQVPGGSLGSASDAEIWRAIRRGVQGEVSIPDKKAGVLVRSDGESWRAFRNGPLSNWGVWVLLGIIGLLALFFLVRGRIRIEAGPANRTIQRFNALDRFTHWLTAVSFIVLAVTGLNLLYGRYVLLPILGPEAFSLITQAGKYAHNFLAFPFMLGVAMMFVLWVKDNIPNKYDVIWLAKGGGMFSKGVHPPSKKFNAGQKLIFWLVVLSGLSLGLSGWALLFPFTMALFSDTFALLNLFGLGLPTDLSAAEEMVLSQTWHAIVGLGITAIIIAHIYIGSIGMEGAFAAMGSGQVDENWAREHHNIWVAEVKGEPIPSGGHGSGGDPGQPRPQPAE